MTHYYICIMLLSSLLSCGVDSEVQEQPYYQFEASDYIRLLDYEENDMLTFKNENEEVILYKVVEISTEFKKASVIGGTFSGGQANIEYYYDEHLIKLMPLSFPNANAIDIVFNRRPATFYRDSVETKFYVTINQFSIWAEVSPIFIDFEQPKNDMLIGTVIYNNVLTIEANLDDIDQDDYRFVNTLYYGEFDGILGFDDVNGSHWRLEN